MSEDVLGSHGNESFQDVCDVSSSRAWESEEIMSACILITLCLQGERSLLCMLTIVGQHI